MNELPRRILAVRIGSHTVTVRAEAGETDAEALRRRFGAVPNGVVVDTYLDRRADAESKIDTGG